ncbi:cold shock domain-containing protein [Leptothoe spongobia]|uniref:Cold shock domain-containing protein n=1 Tax=Leptothoe spongobia TAU-MAC 1115 TaxID=1967444 RepID=A0A947DI54_9CYAN|nr:cold shock domain-containing protein [Leptothoe spongobia]MBT9317073.1 cold shock domain-containing protein [Leptothoe spongobia TAU-MAC 1115]
MAKRLIQRFLHWLRQLLGHSNGSQQHPHPPTLSRQLPPSEVNNQRIPTYSPQESPTADQLGNQAGNQHLPQPIPQPNNNSPSAQTRPRAPLNPASNRANNPSSFRVLLSDYKYSPSPAVQSLSHQLSHPHDQTAASPTLYKTEATLSLKNKISQEDKPVSHSPKTSPDQALNLLRTDNSQLPTIDVNNINQGPISPTSPPASYLIEKQTTQASIPSTPPSVTSPIPPIQIPDSIKKNGVVKLLFKLKKNNHHGYIAPHDGSKDIIFHKKYIGDDVFVQLERGMEVEVTAHITEGKAYADHIRIL